MKKVLSIGLVVVLLAGAQLAMARDCFYSGKYWPPGTRLGPVTCQSDGTWR